MTGTTQPGDFVKFPLLVPAALKGLFVHLSRDEVMIRERDLALAQLALGGLFLGRSVRWRRGGCGVPVLVHYFSQQPLRCNVIGRERIVY